MNLAGSPQSSTEESFPQTVIRGTVNALIAKKGYFEAIGILISEVYRRGEISLADPNDRTKLADFDLWAQAVRAAILKHDRESTFEHRLNSYDHGFADQLKISLR